MSGTRTRPARGSAPRPAAARASLAKSSKPQVKAAKTTRPTPAPPSAATVKAAAPARALAGKAVVKAPAPKVAPAKPVAKAAPPPRIPRRPVASTVTRGINASGATARAPDSPHLRVGDDLPQLVRGPLSRIDIARYCAASGNFSVISLDEPQARAVGLPSVVVPGGLALGLTNALLSRWLREEGRLRSIGVRLVKMVWPNDHLTARARVSELRAGDDGREVDLDVWVENQKGELVLRGQATCTVRLAPGVPAIPEPPAPPPAPRPVLPAKPLAPSPKAVIPTWSSIPAKPAPPSPSPGKAPATSSVRPPSPPTRTRRK